MCSEWMQAINNQLSAHSFSAMIRREPRRGYWTNSWTPITLHSMPRHEKLCSGIVSNAGQLPDDANGIQIKADLLKYFLS